MELNGTLEKAPIASGAMSAHLSQGQSYYARAPHPAMDFLAISLPEPAFLSFRAREAQSRNLERPPDIPVPVLRTRVFRFLTTLRYVRNDMG